MKSADFTPLIAQLNRLEVPGAVQLTQLDHLRLVNSKVDNLSIILSDKLAVAELSLNERTECLEKKIEDLQTERIKVVVEEVSSSLMSKMAELLNSLFANQFAPVFEEVSTSKNILKRIEDDQIELEAEVKALGYEQVYINHVLSQLIAEYDAKKGEKLQEGHNSAEKIGGRKRKGS